MGKSKLKYTVVVDDKVRLDAIGHWSVAKLEILQKYIKPYSKIIRDHRLHAIYVDAFAGPGLHSRKDDGELIKGSPLRALEVEPPFEEYYFIDWNAEKAKYLEESTSDRDNVHVYHGDCNRVLISDVFPRILYSEYKRGLCFLDPYGLQLDWEVVVKAGDQRSLEVMINFPILDINRTVIRDHSNKIPPNYELRMNRFWGDDSWRKLIYESGGDLFDQDIEYRIGYAHDVLPAAFCKRLRDLAGFKYTAVPLPMADDAGHILYFLIFASHNRTGRDIVNDIFSKYRK